MGRATARSQALRRPTGGGAPTARARRRPRRGEDAPSRARRATPAAPAVPMPARLVGRRRSSAAAIAAGCSPLADTSSPLAAGRRWPRWAPPRHRAAAARSAGSRPGRRSSAWLGANERRRRVAVRRPRRRARAAPPAPPRRAWWSRPPIAVGLGLLGAAGAWPAVAGQARGPWTRAALGAPASGGSRSSRCSLDERLLPGPPAAEPRAASSARSRRMAIARGVWAAAALVLPLLVRGRTSALDLLGARRCGRPRSARGRRSAARRRAATGWSAPRRAAAVVARRSRAGR